MDKKVISCAFNIDTACVEVRFVSILLSISLSTTATFLPSVV